MSFLLKNFPCLWNVLRLPRISSSAITFNLRKYSNTSKTTEKTLQPARDLNEPVKFVGSKAASWNTRQGRSGSTNYEEVPDIQTYAVTGSVAILLFYFCYLREENDVDLELEKSLYDRVPGLEQTQLILSYKYNLENNIDNRAIIERMLELGIKAEEIK